MAANLGGLRVLIADDKSHMRTIICSVLTGANAGVGQYTTFRRQPPR